MQSQPFPAASPLALLNATWAASALFYAMVWCSGLPPLDLVRGVVAAGLIAL